MQQLLVGGKSEKKKKKQKNEENGEKCHCDPKNNYHAHEKKDYRQLAILLFLALLFIAWK